MVRRELGLVVLLASACFAQRILPLTEVGEWIGSPALSPDGKTLAFTKSQQILLRSLESNSITEFAREDDKGGSPDEIAWSPDGQRIAFSRGYCHHCPHELFLKNASGGAEFPLGEVCGATPSWTSDGRFLIMATPFGDEEDCQLALIPADGSRRTVLMPNEGNVAAVSPDGKRLLYAPGNVLKLVQLTLDFRLAGIPIALASEPHAIVSIHWAPDGHAVVYQCWGYSRLLPMGGPIYSPTLLDAGGSIQISQILADDSALGVDTIWPTALWRIDISEPGKGPEKVRDIRWTDSTLAVSPNGEMVAFVSGRNGPEQIWVSKLDGSEPRVLVSAIPPYGDYGDNTNAGDLSWSPDGQWIAFLTNPGVGHGDSEARLFLIPSGGGPLRMLVELCALDGRPVPWSPDSKSVFVAQERFEPDGNETHYFQVDILSGKQGAVSEASLPLLPKDLVPAGAEDAHVSQGGRYLYFQKRGDIKSRIVAVHGLLGGK